MLGYVISGRYFQSSIKGNPVKIVIEKQVLDLMEQKIVYTARIIGHILMTSAISKHLLKSTTETEYQNGCHVYIILSSS